MLGGERATVGRSFGQHLTQALATVNRTVAQTFQSAVSRVSTRGRRAQRTCRRPGRARAMNARPTESRRYSSWKACATEAPVQGKGSLRTSARRLTDSCYMDSPCAVGSPLCPGRRTEDRSAPPQCGTAKVSIAECLRGLELRVSGVRSVPPGRAARPGSRRPDTVRIANGQQAYRCLRDDEP